MKCDKEGVPLLIQSLKYWRHNMSVEAKFFSGADLMVAVEALSPGVGLQQDQPTRMQWLEIENNLTKLVLANWSVLGLGHAMER